MKKESIKAVYELTENYKKVKEENNTLQTEIGLLHTQIHEMESQIKALVRALGDANKEREKLFYLVRKDGRIVFND